MSRWLYIRRCMATKVYGLGPSRFFKKTSKLMAKKSRDSDLLKMPTNNHDNPEPPKKSEIKPGSAVWIIEKENYGTDKYKQGVVKEILSPGGAHPRGIKVRLTDGTVGRVQWMAE